MGQHTDQLSRYGEMKEEIAAIRATVSSGDRSVTVVAGPGGAVLDVRLSERAFDAASPHALSSTIMSTLRLAVADAARQQADVVQRYVGDRLNIRDRVMATQQELLGDRIAAGDEERERLRHAPAAPDDGMVLRTDHPQPAVRPAPPRRRPEPASDDFDDDFDPFGGGYRR